MTIDTSQGPDPKSCCCDVCGFARISCNGSGEVPLFAICCKCVPKVLCGVFTPDDTDQCPPIGLFINHGGLGQYHGSLGDYFGFDETLVDVTLQKDEQTGECYWKLSIPDLSIDERKTIDRIYQTCHDIDFAVRLETSYCSGELVISRYDLAKVPFIWVAPEAASCTNTGTWESNLVPCSGEGCNYVGIADGAAPFGYAWQYTSGGCDFHCECIPDGWTGFPRLPTGVGDTLTVPCSDLGLGAEWLPVGVSDANCNCTPAEPDVGSGLDGEIRTTECIGTTTDLFIDHTCGSCSRVCRYLCVEYMLWDEDLNAEVKIRKQFVWDETYQRYHYRLNSIDDYIYLIEDDYETGYPQCYLELDIQDLSGYTFERFNLEPCSSTIDVQITDTGNSKTVGVACKICTCWKHICGSCRCACNMLCLLIYREGVLQLLQLPWFFDEETGEAGWSDGYETVTLTEDETTKQCKISIDGFDPILMDTCGTEITFQLENVDDNSQAFGGCRKCLCFASEGRCCDRLISELPLRLVATVAEFDHCACAGDTFDLIWNPFMNWWRGSGTLGSCYNYSKVTVTVGCPDIVGLQAPVSVITVCGDDGDGPISHQADPTNTIISCDPILIVTDEITVDMSCCDDGLVDDDPYDMIGPIPHPGTFTVTISE